MAAKKSCIVLLLISGLMLLLMIRPGEGSKAQGDKTAYSNDNMSYNGDLNSLSDETEAILLEVASAKALSGGIASVINTTTDYKQDEAVLISSPLSIRAENESEVSSQASEPAQDPLTEYAASHVLTKDSLIDTALNVRRGPGADYEVVGRMYPRSAGIILEERDGWTRISSGNVEGWVSDEFLIKGETSVRGTLIEKGYAFGTAETDSLNIYSRPDDSSEVIGALSQGQECLVEGYPDLDWTRVYVSEAAVDGYVSAEYITVRFALLDAMTLEEEEAYLAEKARLAEEARAALAASEAARQAQTQSLVQSMAASLGTGAVAGIPAEDIVLMAAVVDHEALSEPYEGKLAVANVMVNRFRSGIWGDMHSVLYAPGQFTCVTSGGVNQYLPSPSADSMRAVMEACAGVNNIGGLMYFCSAKSANPAAYRVYMWVGSQCFYMK